uniref:Saccharopine dehydrogenase NADP binding domain-containing protein n=1 Tax=Spongospora subterranea TaxID=70186 RepID=A0A0H5R854_9EUKA|eukprot:CRZ10308.1 hypothetical protein [Spongospora subterranea]
MGRSSGMYDIVVFGATGFTGRRVCEYLYEANFREGYKIAIAGRSRERMQKVLDELESKYPMVVANVDDPISLRNMAMSAKLIINCVGPFRFSGEGVVAACIEAQADYIDICGEPEFLERIQLKYHDAAVATDTLIVGACGFDSIPGDIGAMFTRQKLKEAGATSISSIECIIRIQNGIQGSKVNFATYESAVYGIGNSANLRDIRKQFATRYNDHPQPKGLKLDRPSYHYDERVKSWVIPFFGADGSVVRRSSRFDIPKGVPKCPQFHAYFAVSSIPWLLAYFIFGCIFWTLAKFRLGRYLLLQFPELFSCGFVSRSGPDVHQIRTTSFVLKFFGKGYSSFGIESSKDPDISIQATVVGPEPGYVTTPICAVQSAFVLLKERERLPFNGGVLTPAVAFGESSLFSRLNANGVVFTSP